MIDVGRDRVYWLVVCLSSRLRRFPHRPRAGVSFLGCVDDRREELRFASSIALW